MCLLCGMPVLSVKEWSSNWTHVVFQSAIIRHAYRSVYINSDGKTLVLPESNVDYKGK